MSYNKKSHQSTDSNGSTYPLPSLCSSLSSHNSSSKSLSISKQQHNSGDGYYGAHNGSADNESVQQQQQQNSTQHIRKRWDDSQFAIELCDKSLRGQDKSTNSKSTTKSIKNKILKSKFFHYQQQELNNTRHDHYENDDNTHSHKNNSSSSNSTTSSSHSNSNNSQISVKFTSLLRKIKGMKI